MSEGASGGVPYYLMPLAAVFGTYVVLATLNAFYTVYRNVTHKKESTSIPPTPIKSGKFLLTVVSIIVSVFIYGYIVGQVENALLEDAFANSIFDPYDILAIPTSSNSTVVKQAFRSLSKVHHPDKGGDERIFHQITLAYKALTDPVGKKNFELFGHPDGKPSSPTLNFALPEWLLFPKGNVALVLVLMYLGLFVGIIMYVVKYVTSAEDKVRKTMDQNSVAGGDLEYLAHKLGPDSTHWEILYYIATTPESIDITAKGIEKTQEVRDKKIAKLKQAAEEAKKSNSITFDDDDGGWADDDDETEEEKAAAAAFKKTEQEIKLQKAKLANTMGKEIDPLELSLEGIDEGVIGQQWVEDRLTDLKVWPPKLPENAGTFKDYSTGKVVDPLDHPAVRKNILMTMGRLNSVVLNTNPELVKAAASQKIDQTYFKGNLEFRQRNSLLLEAALRVATTARSYRLAKTIIETVAMFKIGTTNATSEKNIKHFQSNMEKIYGGKEGIPRINIKVESLCTPGEDEMATGDLMELGVSFERLHADNFTRQKLALAQKQNIPPQLALQQFREVWWVLLRATREGAGDAKSEINEGLTKLVSDASVLKKFEDEPEENYLLLAYPFIINKIMTKEGLAKIQFQGPKIPGKYTLNVTFMSGDFLGCNSDVQVPDVKIVDAEEVQRKQAEEDAEDQLEDDDDDEGKKTK